MGGVRKQICEKCGKKVDELYSRQGFVQTYFIEFVCKKCFKKMEKVDWEDYSEKHYYKEIKE